MAKSILQIRRGKNYTSRNFTRDVSLSPQTRDLLPGGMKERERERERVGFTLNGTCFSWANSRLFLSVVISYKGFALGNLYSNLKKILFIGFFFLFRFFFWIIDIIAGDELFLVCNVISLIVIAILFKQDVFQLHFKVLLRFLINIPSVIVSKIKFDYPYRVIELNFIIFKNCIESKDCLKILVKLGEGWFEIQKKKR